VTAALRAELRRVTSTRLWWALLIPVAVLAAVVNLFGGLLGDAVGDSGGDLPVLLASVAFTLTLVAVFAGVYGAVIAAGEFRHRTVTTTYLPAHALAGPAFGDQVVEQLAGVTAPPPWWGALAVLAGWATLVALAASAVADRRDIT
jgi:hypothetical protein